MRVLLTGAGGQVGAELARRAPRGVDVVALDRAGLDIRREADVRAVVGDVGPDLILNAAAYTAVDRAESEPEEAFAVNEAGARALAAAAAAAGGRMLHLSTDFVFSGNSGRPYAPGDPPDPVNVYGRSKAAGERAVLELLGSRSLVVRTSWVYGPRGSNFLTTVLWRLREHHGVRVVTDQVGGPTAAPDLARAVWDLATREWRADGGAVVHVANPGSASRCQWAAAIRDLGVEMGMLDRESQVTPIRTADLPGGAPRPACSVLDTAATWRMLGYRLAPWRSALRDVLREVAVRHA
ncbi:MAG TPA: dTDP-4-dehydrorhamnose reductase [Longimicrobiales bacterium]|nr:dTDP-4-dehydrorhamnose reductase [Longimicrobiales bacterium]